MKKLLSVLFLAYLLCTTAFSQPSQNSQPQTPLGKKEIREIVSVLADSVKQNYVDEKIANSIHKQLKQNITKGEYDKVTSPQELSALLSKQLVALSTDLHFGVDYKPVTANSVQRRMPNTYNHLAPYNYHFAKMEILPGNIGLLQIDQFVPTEYTGHLIVAAMNFFSNTDALIIDLRKCIGGDPRTVAQLSGYFFKEPVLLHVSNSRVANVSSEFWSTKTDFKATERGKIAFTTDAAKEIKADYSKLTEIPIYVLTSNTTFSAGEGMAFGLQTRGRAKTVGETTGHGGNGVRPFRLPHNFQVFIPFVEVVSPITGKGYQQTGVLPDIPTTPAKAIEVAHATALQQLHEQATDEATKRRLAWEIRVTQLRKQPEPQKELKFYAGKYGTREIKFEEGDLYYQREGGTKTQLEPLGNRHFLMDKFTILEFSPDFQTLQIHQQSGSSNAYNRTDKTANLN